MPLQTEPPFVHGLAARTAVVLMNLGTPDAPTPGAVRRYLRQFLSDSRVVELPRLLWLPLLHGVILPLRARQSAAKYASIWARDGGRAVSPLLLHTERQAAALQQALGDAVIVTHAMRYGNPSFASVLQRLREQGAERILLLPMYPQYSSSTTASAYDDAFATLRGLRNQPAVRTIRSYHDDPGYISALRAQVEQYWAAHGRPDFAAGDTLVLTFHGVPRKMLDAGDPYHCHCLKTGRLLGEALGLAPGQYRVTFQSRFGRAQWLQPYTAQTLEALGRAGTRRVDVFCPGFPADCLETLEEIAQEGRELFVHAGGGDYHYIPCVNDAPAWIDALAQIAHAHLQGWLAEPDAAGLAASRQRAAAAGATNA